MKPKKYERLLVVMSRLDDCESLCSSLNDKRVRRKKHRDLRHQIVATLQADLAELKLEILKL